MATEEFKQYLIDLRHQLRLHPEENDWIAVEIEQHLEQQLSDLMGEGWTEQDAIRHCLHGFGDVQQLAVNLSHANRSKERREWQSMLIVACVCFLGSLFLAFRRLPETEPLRLSLPKLSFNQPEPTPMTVLSVEQGNKRIREQLDQNYAAVVPPALPLDSFFHQLLDGTEIKFHLLSNELEQDSSLDSSLTPAWSIPHTRLRTALDILLPSMGMTYQVRGGLLVIGELNSFDQKLIRQNYSVFFSDKPSPLSPSDWDDLIAAIQSGVCPQSWNSGSGPQDEKQQHSINQPNGLAEVQRVGNRLFIAQRETAHQKIKHLLSQLGARASP